VVIEVGQMLGRYKMAAKLGNGAFGSVWLAEDTWLSKRVALKIPHNQEQDFSKLIEEPKLLAAMDHPNIIKLLTVDKVEGIIFMVMEYVEGSSLKERIAKGPMAVPEVLDLARGMLEALAYAHQKGLVHRDLKPANILLTMEGLVKITDFGTAHAILTGEETIAAGTLFYMPKEQLMGRVTPSSDIYAVGVMIYEMLTGKLPFFDESGSKLIQKILSETAPPDPAVIRSDIPPELSRLIRRALMPDVRLRWKKAEEFIEAIDAFRAGKAVPEAPMPVPPPLPAYEKFSRRIPKLADSLNLTHWFEYEKALGGRGRSGAQFLLPSGLTFGVEGELFVTDSIRNCVLIFDRNGEYGGAIGSEGGILDQGVRFRTPSGIVADRDGLLYVTDTKNCRVVIFTRGEELIKQFGRPVVVMGVHAEKGIIGFNYPRGLALDEAGGLLYVSDTGNNRLRCFTMGGLPVATFGSLGDRTNELNAPLGIATGSGGKLYVADSQNFRIQVFEKEFRFVETIGRRGTNPGEFTHPPASMFVTANDELIVCDDTDRLHVFGADGRFIGMITGPRTAGLPPKYISVACREGEDLFAVDENGCQIHCFTWREKPR